jgi:hypothetical protein
LHAQQEPAQTANRHSIPGTPHGTHPRQHAQAQQPLCGGRGRVCRQQLLQRTRGAAATAAQAAGQGLQGGRALPQQPVKLVQIRQAAAGHLLLQRLQRLLSRRHQQRWGCSCAAVRRCGGGRTCCCCGCGGRCRTAGRSCSKRCALHAQPSCACRCCVLLPMLRFQRSCVAGCVCRRLWCSRWQRHREACATRSALNQALKGGQRLCL